MNKKLTNNNNDIKIMWKMYDKLWLCLLNKISFIHSFLYILYFKYETQTLIHQYLPNLSWLVADSPNLLWSLGSSAVFHSLESLHQFPLKQNKHIHKRNTTRWTNLLVRPDKYIAIKSWETRQRNVMTERWEVLPVHAFLSVPVAVSCVSPSSPAIFPLPSHSSTSSLLLESRTTHNSILTKATTTSSLSARLLPLCISL